MRPSSNTGHEEAILMLKGSQNTMADFQLFTPAATEDAEWQLLPKLDELFIFDN